MLIADGNLTYAVINALTGKWLEPKSSKLYIFECKETNPLQLALSIDSSKPIDCSISFADEICYLEFNRIKYRLWYMDNTKDVKLELHAEEMKIKLDKYKPKGQY